MEDLDRDQPRKAGAHPRLRELPGRAFSVRFRDALALLFFCLSVPLLAGKAERRDQLIEVPLEPDAWIAHLWVLRIPTRQQDHRPEIHGAAPKGAQQLA